MPDSKDAALIELAYAASFLLLAKKAQRSWNEPMDGVTTPGELEKECYRLCTELGLDPIREFGSPDALQDRWRKQLRSDRHRDMLDLGMLLVKQHGLMSYLQCHPASGIRPMVCFQLEQLRASLQKLLARHGLAASVAKLPKVDLADASEEWKTWSGNALRESVLEELRTPAP